MCRQRNSRPPATSTTDTAAALKAERKRPLADASGTLGRWQLRPNGDHNSLTAVRSLSDTPACKVTAWSSLSVV
jgi:hypothetical protein